MQQLEELAACTISPLAAKVPIPLRRGRSYDLQVSYTFQKSYDPDLSQLVIDLMIPPNKDTLDCLELAIDQIESSNCPEGDYQKSWLMVCRRKSADCKRSRNAPPLDLKVGAIQTSYGTLNCRKLSLQKR